MRSYLATRVLTQLATLFLVIVVVFLVTHAIGDPVRLMFPEAPYEVVQAVRVKYGLDQPLHVQFIEYFVGLLQLDFGKSVTSGLPNLQLILSRLPATVQLALVGTGLAAAIGIPLGVVAALRPRSVVDRIIALLSTVALTSLDFWIAMLLIYAVAVELRWLPTSGYGDLRFLVLPAIVVALRPIGRNAQVTRPAILNELTKPYIVALRARGVPEVRIVALHVGRNAGIVLLTLIGYEFALMINGSAIIETVFAWPGIGFMLVQAVYGRDWPLITSITIFVAVLVMALNLVIDLVYGWLDPRVQYR